MKKSVEILPLRSIRTFRYLGGNQRSVLQRLIIWRLTPVKLDNTDSWSVPVALISCSNFKTVGNNHRTEVNKSNKCRLATQGKRMFAVAIRLPTAQMLQVVLGKFQTVSGGVRSRARPANRRKPVFNRPQFFQRKLAAAFQFQFHAFKLLLCGSTRKHMFA